MELVNIFINISVALYSCYNT